MLTKALQAKKKEISMILRPLATIHSKGAILKIGDKEIPFETRLEYSQPEDNRPARERCIGADGFEAKHDTAFLEKYGVRATWNRLSLASCVNSNNFFA